MRRLIALAFALTFAAQSAAAESALSLDLLSDCAQLSDVQAELRSHRYACRRPRTSLESILLERVSIWGRNDYCAVDPGEAMLARFSCVRGVIENYIQLSCFREVGSGILTEYRKNYRDKYAKPVRDYLALASQCGIGNGDASIGVSTLFNAPLVWIAKWSFGYILPLGKGLVGQNMSLHGYAVLDPDIRPNRAVEFFIMDFRT